MIPIDTALFIAINAFIQGALFGAMAYRILRAKAARGV
jgi:hypothetical protein